ncbi:hypothetical protein [Mucilaginibacter antarcticus]|uniref:Uncharacterized protein n=1 Tax=Mucilaginibacter antarcticus TaxID=1855725 RepID=A0ABW5XKE5_9SPHI
MKPLPIFVLALLALCCTSCSNNDIKDLSRLNPASNEYKQELVKIIAEHGDELTFTFNKYLTTAGKDYLDVTVDGRGGLHANALILVTNWAKLEGIRRTKGIGYRGAELRNLQVALIDADTHPVMVYRGLDSVAD